MTSKKRIGLYFGTFNPIHVGHVIIANHIVEFSNLDEVWFVVTPHNPLKKKSSLLNDFQRLTMVRIAIEDCPKLKDGKVEFDLPQPNYTVNTLAYLEDKHPELDFNLIVGEDNLTNFHKWKNYEVILDRYSIYVYPRVQDIATKVGASGARNIIKIEAPRIEISSTFIRKCIKEGKNIRPMLPESVWKYIDEMNFYK